MLVIRKGNSVSVKLSNCTLNVLWTQRHMLEIVLSFYFMEFEQ